MKSATQCLQTSDIEALLAGTVPATQSELWEEHFSSCESCRMAMAGQVGDQEWWREAEQSLMSASIPEVRDSVKSEADERESIEDLLKLLGPTDDPQMLGRIGSYEVLGVLGRGGMGVVFKAFDAPLNRFVAIKMLLPHLAASGSARKRFAREGQAVAAVVDDHVMAIHCVDEWQGVPYLVMTYSRGVSLQKRLSDNGPLEVREILRIGMQAAKGLAAAHAQGIVHRDIKPANIFLDQKVERVQLMDFGLARAVDDASLTRSGTLTGTPQYMSPEQARAETVDHRSDLFSLGSVLYAMCTGHAPFRAESSYSVLRLITDTEPRSIREINPDIPEWLCLLISRLMAKSPDARFGNALEVAALLEQCLAHVQQPTSVPLPASLVPHAAGRRSIFNVTRKGVIAMLGTLGMTLLGMVLWQATEAPDISGQWTSDEWGGVVLEAKGAGEYEGTFTGTGKDKPAPSNDAPGGGTGGVSAGSGLRINVPGMGGPAPLAFDFPRGGPDGLGVSPKSEPDALSDSNKTKSGTLDLESPQKFQSIIGVTVEGEVEHFDLGTTFPLPTVPLPTVRFLDKFRSGTLHLKWSRVERRFNGTWGKGADRSGTMSLRLVDEDIRGGFTTDEEVQLETGTPLVGDLLWTRSVVTVPDGGNVLLGGLPVDETVPTPLKIPPGEILVDVYAGRSVWYLPEKEVDKLLHSFKSLRGVTVQVHEDGKGDAFTKAVVHAPAPVRDEPAENQKREERIRTIKISIDEALREHKVPNVRWLDANGKQNDGPAAQGGERNETAIANSSDWKMHQVFNPAHDQNLWAVAFTPDGKTIASAAADQRVKFWDVATGALRSTMARSVNCTDVAYSPDGIYLAIAGGDHGDDPKGEVVLFDGAGDGEEFVLESHESSRYSTSVAFSPDNRWLASGGIDKMVKIWSVPQRKLHKMLTDHTELVSQVVFSPTGKMLASASFDDTVRLWSVPDGDAIATLRGHKKEVRGIAFSSDSKLLVSASEDGTARVWNTSSGEQLGVMDGHGGSIFSVAFAPDGQYVATGSRGPSGVIIWDVNTRKGVSPIVLPQQKQEVVSLAFSPDGQMLAIVGGLNGFQIWKRKVAAEVPEIEKPLDRQNARAVVEAYFAAAIAGQIDEATSLTKFALEDRPAARRGAEESSRWLNDQLKVQRLAVKSVYVDDPEKPVAALATTEAIRFANQRLDSEREVLLVALVMSREGWLLSLGEPYSEQSADRELKQFLEANPKSISVPPLTKRPASNQFHDLQGVWEYISVEADGVVTEYKTPASSEVLSITDNLWKMNSLMGSVNRVEIDGRNLTFHGKTSTGSASGVGGDVPSIAYGIYTLDDDSLGFCMTPFVPSSQVGTGADAFGGPVIKHPQSFETKGTQNRAYRLRRSAAKVSAIEKPLDRQTARAVVEAFVAAAIAGDETTINTLAPIGRSQAGVELYFGELKFLKAAKLLIESVYVNDLAKPTKALATSVEVRLEGKTPRLHEPRGGFLVLTLSMSENGWSVTEIDFEPEKGADHELKKFLEANPKSVSVPPQATSEAVKSTKGTEETKTVVMVVARDSAQESKTVDEAAKAVTDAKLPETIQALTASIVTVTRIEPADGGPGDKSVSHAGMVVDPRGYIVIPLLPSQSKSKRFMVRLAEQQEVVGQLAAIDESLKFGVLKIERPQPVAAVSLAKSRDARVDDRVILVPSPATKELRRGQVTSTLWLRVKKAQKQ